MIHPKYTQQLVAILMSGMMTLFMTSVVTMVNTGIDAQYMVRWLIAWLVAWPLAFFGMLAFKPMAIAIAKRLTKIPEQNSSNSKTDA